MSTKSNLPIIESFKSSDIALMLNHKKPKGTSKIVYKNDLTSKELAISFNPIKFP